MLRRMSRPGGPGGGRSMTDPLDAGAPCRFCGVPCRSWFVHATVPIEDELLDPVRADALEGDVIVGDGAFLAAVSRERGPAI